MYSPADLLVSSRTPPNPSPTSLALILLALIRHPPTNIVFLQHDPAVDKWVAMRESMHKGFRFRRQNIGPILALAVVMPACIYQLCVYEKVRRLFPQISGLCEERRVGEGADPFRLCPLRLDLGADHRPFPFTCNLTLNPNTLQPLVNALATRARPLRSSSLSCIDRSYSISLSPSLLPSSHPTFLPRPHSTLNPTQNQEVDPLMNVRGVPRNKADRKASDLETNPHLKFWDPYGGCEGKEGDERSAAIKNKMGQ